MVTSRSGRQDSLARFASTLTFARLVRSSVSASRFASPPGNLGSLAYTERSRSWGHAGIEPKRDALTLDLTNVAKVKVDPKRAKLSCRPDFEVTTDGPATVKLAGCHRKLRFGS